MKKIRKIDWMIFIVLIVSLPAFSQGIPGASSVPLSVGTIIKAICVLHPTKGNNVNGIVTFTLTDVGIRVVADVQGLTQGKHGFHIHDYGDCSADDASSAGGHFNPEGHDHGAPSDRMRHAGDMGNLVADETGKAHLEYIDPMLKFEGTGSIIGRSMIVHEKEDDLKTQPTGNAGPRIACGVIGLAK
jgi:Cu-Zn family superoxide dismutase